MLRIRGLYLVVGIAFAMRLEALEPTMSVQVENAATPIIHGTTNLPDGSELIVSIWRKESTFLGMSDVKVVHGHFTTARFSAGSGPVNSGVYKIEVTMSVAALQPPEVRAVIGESGERMTGRLVRQLVPGVEPTFDFVTDVQLGGAPDAASDNIARAKTLAESKRWAVETCTSEVDKGLLGPVNSGAERQSKISACYADATSGLP